MTDTKGAMPLSKGVPDAQSGLHRHEREPRASAPDENGDESSDERFDPDRRAAAKRYSRISLAMGIAMFVLSLAILVALLATGLSSAIRDHYDALGFSRPAVVAAYLLTLIALLAPIELPLAFLSGYILEHRFGLSDESIAHWLKREAKGLALGLGIGLGLIEALYWLLAVAPAYWWLYAAGGYWLLSVVMAKLAPVLIMPLFYTQTPLEDEALKERLQALAKQAGYGSVPVFAIDLSRESKKANAALTGTGRTRRVILTDTLVEDYSPAEIESVLGHELGHHHHHHIAKGIVINLGVILASFWFVHTLLQWALPLTNAWFGLDLTGIADIAAFPLILLALTLFGVITLPLDNALSRRFEREADRYELETVQDPTAFISSMVKLSDQNLSQVEPHPVLVWFLYSHPPVKERIGMATAYRARTEATITERAEE